MNLEHILNSLMSITTLKDISTDKALEIIAQLTDVSFDLQRIEGAEHAIELSDELQLRDLTSLQLSELYYYLANAWANIRTLSRRGTELAWDWQQDELDKEIFYLRKAIQSDNFMELSDESACKIYTNLGNILDHVGRFVEAIEYWDRALSRSPSFAMARGNKGFCLTLYANVLYDQGHRPIFLKSAHVNLKEALSHPLQDDARDQFNDIRIKIESVLPAELLNQNCVLHNFPCGSSEQEIRYRQWCLRNRLFLNPLNDLGHYSIAACDVLSTPSITVSRGCGPYYQGFFNQMKQEFISARYLCYEGISEKETHFSDREVLLINTLDYPAYSLAVEKVKIAFRTVYSIFDKIAYFLNHYLQLSIPEKRITFRTFWYELQSKEKGLKKSFQKLQNWPLRGLFWLSRDLYEEKSGFRAAIEPDAQELSDIRNHLEHKYLKLHDDLWLGKRYKKKKSVALEDTLAFSIYRLEFEAKTLRLMKMVRAALIYLSLGIHYEEQQRMKDDSPVGKVVLDVWEDDWKK